MNQVGDWELVICLDIIPLRADLQPHFAWRAVSLSLVRPAGFGAFERGGPQQGISRDTFKPSNSICDDTIIVLRDFDMSVLTSRVAAKTIAIKLRNIKARGM
jgi:hypothetical protein